MFSLHYQNSVNLSLNLSVISRLMTNSQAETIRLISSLQMVRILQDKSCSVIPVLAARWLHSAHCSGARHLADTAAISGNSGAENLEIFLLFLYF